MKRNLYSCILIISSFAASVSAADNPALILDDGCFVLARGEPDDTPRRL